MGKQKNHYEQRPKLCWWISVHPMNPTLPTVISTNSSKALRGPFVTPYFPKFVHGLTAAAENGGSQKSSNSAARPMFFDRFSLKPMKMNHSPVLLGTYLMILDTSIKLPAQHTHIYIYIFIYILLLLLLLLLFAKYIITINYYYCYHFSIYC